VVDHYSSTIMFKDPAQITLGLRDLGIDAMYVSRSPAIARSETAPFPLVQGGALEDSAFWRSLRLDAALVISRLDPTARSIIDAVRAAGIRLVLKADSDGTLGYPLVPNYLRILDWRGDPLRTLARTLKWRAPVRLFVGHKLEQVAVADAVVVESPAALDNVRRVLRFWNMQQYASRVHFVPNPVAPDMHTAPVSEDRPPVIAAIGRWDDWRPKNTPVMVESISGFLQARDDFRASIIGPGADQIESLLKRCPGWVRARIEVTGAVEHHRLPSLLDGVRMLLMPSRMESFGIAAAEAACAGCSVVVTPVESLRYLAGDGLSGTIAEGFGTTEVLDALLRDARRWDDGEYSPARTAARWRTELDRRAVAQRLLPLLSPTA
jgi:glycosyltransferase involved in cell wall biosynthesis